MKYVLREFAPKWFKVSFRIIPPRGGYFPGICLHGGLPLLTFRSGERLQLLGQRLDGRLSEEVMIYVCI